MNPEADTKSLYKIWRRKKGRSMKRWLTDTQAATYKIAYPHWRWQKVEVEKENRSYQASLQTRPSQAARSYTYSWGRNTPELRESKDFLSRQDLKTISYDDILDVQLELKKGI